MLGRVLRNVFARSERPAAPTKLAPPSEAALVERANAFAAAGDHAGAIALYDEALAQNPGSAVVRWDRALSLTALGRIREAWADADARFETVEKMRRFVGSAPLPAWRGEPLPSGRLMVLWEQALGDIVQHLRFLPLARKRASAISFYCPQELVTLVAASFPDVDVVPADGRQPVWERYAAFIPLISLPHALGLDWPTLPTAPYLLRHEPPPTEVENRVGIVWRSSGFEPARDCPLEDMIAALGPDTAAVSLQFGTTPEEQALLAARGIPEAVGSDFLETARRIRALAAVVSVDTSVAHVAGALGRPTLLLLNEPAAVRWMLRRADSPWYPTMRILRKPARDAWRAFAPRAAAELRSMVAHHPSERALRLNLGCGSNLLPGYLNVDLYGTPDVRWNLEEAPWPWESDTVEEVRMSHVLEHLGQSPPVFIGVMKELYRVCRHDARVYIRVPHPRHDFFLTDPTHVRPILPGTLELFSLRRNLEWEAQGIPSTPLGKYHGIDFEVEETQFVLDEPYATQLKDGKITQEQAVDAAKRFGNVVTEIKITLRAVKEPAGK